MVIDLIIGLAFLVALLATTTSILIDVWKKKQWGRNNTWESNNTDNPGNTVNTWRNNNITPT